MKDGKFTLKVTNNNIEFFNEDGSPCNSSVIEQLKSLAGREFITNAYVYVLKRKRYYKIGMTNDLHRRIGEQPGELEFAIPCGTYTQAKEIEKKIHAVCEPFRIKGDVFDLLPSQIDLLRNQKTILDDLSDNLGVISLFNRMVINFVEQKYDKRDREGLEDLYNLLKGVDTLNRSIERELYVGVNE